MARVLKRYGAPLAVGLILFTASCGWAWLYWEAIVDNEQSHLDRMSQGLAESLGILLDPTLSGVAPDDVSRGRLIQQKVQLRRPLVYARVVRGDRTIASLGDVPPGLEDPLSPGSTPDGRLVVVRHRLAGPDAEPRPGPREPPEAPEPRGPPGPPRPGGPEGSLRPDAPEGPPAVPWRWLHAPDPVPTFLVVGCEAGLPPHVYRRYVPQVLFALAVGWAGIAALMLAWYRSIRSRDLARALDRERRERERLEEMNLAAAGLAHETKNPLGIILGLAQRVARDPAIGPQTREAAEQIVDAADQAAARLGDFLGFARVPAARPEPVRADHLLTRVVAALQADCDDAGVGVSVVAPPVFISCSPALVEQVLVNLLLNSLQASDRGSQVTLRVLLGGHRASLLVEDQGRGIPPALVPHIFKPYVTGRSDGHGLGLAIVKRIVDQHGWSIGIDSGVAGGTRVTISGIEVTGPAESTT